MMRAAPRIVVVTDPAYAPDVILSQLALALAAVPDGTLAVQLRDRRGRPESLARALRDLTRAHGAWLLVNRDVALAADVGADGVHFGSDPVDPHVRERLGPAAWVTVAAHTEDDIHAAVHAGADAAFVSPVFVSPGKGAPRGTAALARAREIAPNLALFALGGVEPSNAASCFAAGASGVAVIRAVLGATDPAAVARFFLCSAARCR